MHRTVAVTLATVVLTGVAAVAQPTASVWDGIYTEAQAGQGAQPASQNGFKVTLLRRTVLRALQIVTA